jgi:hypothetical protein
MQRRGISSDRSSVGYVVIRCARARTDRGARHDILHDGPWFRGRPSQEMDMQTCHVIESSAISAGAGNPNNPTMTNSA